MWLTFYAMFILDFVVTRVISCNVGLSSDNDLRKETNNLPEAYQELRTWPQWFLFGKISAISGNLAIILNMNTFVTCHQSLFVLIRIRLMSHLKVYQFNRKLLTERLKSHTVVNSISDFGPSSSIRFSTVFYIRVNTFRGNGKI